MDIPQACYEPSSTWKHKISINEFEKKTILQNFVYICAFKVIE